MRHPHIALNLTLALALLSALAANSPAQEKADGYAIQAVPFTAVHVEDGFWAPRLETNRAVTIPYCFEKCEETGRIDNFAKAAKLKEGGHEGLYFNDSDVFKVIEGAAYSLSNQPDPELEKYVDGVIDLIAAAQEPDGYLYTARTLAGIDDYMPPGGPERWSDIGMGHELYNVGHMYEAAVAYFQATGKRKFLDVSIKNADLICSVFGPEGKSHPPGHQEIEIGLVRLYRVTGDKKYLDMADFFVDARGRSRGGRGLYGGYSQDHKPLAEQDEAVGHAVRAGYYYCGVADVAALSDNAGYRAAIDRLWRDVVDTKLYITGGIGARGSGEAFGEKYELPNRSAYAETCAAIANALWNQRMFLLHGDAQYADVLERVLYNGFLSGISLEGNTFFYPNPLESHGDRQRSEWFHCSCCPSNIVRFIPSIPGYIYATRDDGLYVNLYIGSKSEIALGDRTIALTQKTNYPWDGKVAIGVEPGEAVEMALRLRIPGWVRNAPVPSDLYRYEPIVYGDDQKSEWTLRVNGEEVEFEMENGYAVVRREWAPDDRIDLDFPMPVRRVRAHPQVDAAAGKVAFERGPIVFCAEGVDQPDGQVLNMALMTEGPLLTEFRPDLLRGVQVVRAHASTVRRTAEGGVERDEVRPMTFIPYYAWAHRGASQMAVWVPDDLSKARPLPAPTIASTSRVRTSGGSGAGAINDQLEPASSIDHDNPFFHWWPTKGTLEWVQYDFAEPTTVSAVEVYWFDDTGIGECRLPASWRLLYRDGEDWKPVDAQGPFGVAPDLYNRVAFEPVETGALRLEVQLPENFSAGIHEWRVEGQ